MSIEAFPTTCWSRILAAPRTGQAEVRPDLERLARDYWRPVHAYLRTRGRTDDDTARDATQEFFLELLEGDLVQRADPGRGRFRGFLKTALACFLVDKERERSSLRRGGGETIVSLTFDGDAPAIPDVDASPDEALDAVWRRDVVASAARAVGRSLESDGKAEHWAIFRDYFLATDSVDYAALAERHGISKADVSNRLMYAKRRFQKEIRERVLATVSSPDELESELRWLLAGEAG